MTAADDSREAINKIFENYTADIFQSDLQNIKNDIYLLVQQAVAEARLTDNHDWDTETFAKQAVTVCRRCATTYQTRGNKPCKGKMTKIGLRQQQAEEER